MFLVASLSLYPADRVALGVTSFRDTDNLSSNSGSSVDPAIAASGDNVYVAWSDKTLGNPEIIFRASMDGGETFTAKSKGRLSNTDSASVTPRVASNGDSVYVVWVERGSSAKTDIYLRASHNSGASFENIKNLSNSGTAAEPQVATTGDHVYIAWSDSMSGNRDVYLISSGNGGESFDDPINLSKNGGVSDQPQISATEDGHVYVTWRDSISGSKEILFRASNDNGNTFGEIKNISNNAGSSSNPEISASDDAVYITWTDNTIGNVEVFFAASTNGGGSFSSPINLSDTAGTSYRVQIAAVGDKVYVAWRDTPREVYIRISENAGDIFADSVNLSNDEADSGWPEISAIGDSVYIVWRAGPVEGFSKEVYAQASEDGGNSFDGVVNLSDNPGNSGPPQVAAGSGGNIFVVWSDTSTGSGDIYFKSRLG